jgi:hypothetical protein
LQSPRGILGLAHDAVYNRGEQKAGQRIAAALPHIRRPQNQAVGKYLLRDAPRRWNTTTHHRRARQNLAPEQGAARLIHVGWRRLQDPALAGTGITSSVHTLKLLSEAGPKLLLIATSAASRPAPSGSCLCAARDCGGRRLYHPPSR